MSFYLTHVLAWYSEANKLKVKDDKIVDGFIEALCWYQKEQSLQNLELLKARLETASPSTKRNQLAKVAEQVAEHVAEFFNVSNKEPQQLGIHLKILKLFINDAWFNYEKHGAVALLCYLNLSQFVFL